MAALAATISLPPGAADTFRVGICGNSPTDGDIRSSPLGQASFGHVATAGSTVSGALPLTLDCNGRGEQTKGSR